MSKWSLPAAEAYKSAASSQQEHAIHWNINGEPDRALLGNVLGRVKRNFGCGSRVA